MSSSFTSNPGDGDSCRRVPKQSQDPQKVPKQTLDPLVLEHPGSGSVVHNPGTPTGGTNSKIGGSVQSDLRKTSPPPICISEAIEAASKRSGSPEKGDEVCLSPGYKSYSQKLLLQLPTEYDTSTNDDLSADETYEVPPLHPKKTSNWRKVRNVVQWTPFIQTYKRHKYPWVQLAGHQGNFKAGYKQGTILKKLCPAEESALEAIAKDVLRPYAPEYLGVVESSDGDKYLQLQDLLSDFSSPCVMDIKMGVRTYLEEELAKARHKPKLRKDMFEKMVQIDPNAPNEAERKAKAVTKPRYMVWRETISSTATLGFRIEGVRRGDGTSTKDFKTTRTRDQVMAAFEGFLEGYSHIVPKYIQRLKAIQSTLENSKFFHSHELIGSSLLFVHNQDKAGVWLIDFAKTIPLPNSVKVTHKAPWVEGTHEDGYLIGLGNLVELLDKYLQISSASKETKQDQPEFSNKNQEQEATEASDQIKNLNLTSKEETSTSQASSTPENDSPSRLPSTKTGDSAIKNELPDKSSGTDELEQQETLPIEDDSSINKHFSKSHNSSTLSDSFEAKCPSFQMPKNAD